MAGKKNNKNKGKSQAQAQAQAPAQQQAQEPEKVEEPVVEQPVPVPEQKLGLVEPEKVEAAPVQEESKAQPEESKVSKIAKTGHKILLKIGDYKPSSEEPDLDKEGRAAFIYRNAKFVEKIELEDPKALEIQFKNALPGEVLRIMVQDTDCQTVDEPDYTVSFDIHEFFMSEEKMIYGKTYSTNIGLLDEVEDDLWDGAFGEDDFKMDEGEPVLHTEITLSKFDYEEVIKKATSRAVKARAGRSPGRDRAGSPSVRSPRRSAGAAPVEEPKTEEPKKEEGALKKFGKFIKEAVIDNVMEVLDSSKYEKRENDGTHVNDWGEHKKIDYHPSWIAKVEYPDAQVASIKRSEFIGGHYISDRFESRDELEEEVMNHKFGESQHHGLTFRNSIPDARHISEFYDYEYYHVSEKTSHSNYYCPQPYEKSYEGFKRFNFQTDKAPEAESWKIEKIPNMHSSMAARQGEEHNVREEKRKAIALLDAEIAKRADDVSDQDANNRLQTTINYLKKRQTDTIAWENRQMCKIYDVDYMADEMTTLNKNSTARDKESKKIKQVTDEYTHFGADNQEKHAIPGKINKTQKDLDRQRKILKDLQAQQRMGCIKLGMEPDKPCKDAYTTLLAREIMLQK